MTNREWADLIAKEFDVSNTTAKRMLSATYKARKIILCKYVIRSNSDAYQDGWNDGFYEGINS